VIRAVETFDAPVVARLLTNGRSELIASLVPPPLTPAAPAPAATAATRVARGGAAAAPRHPGADTPASRSS
jgi:hypothetical protein